MWEPGSTSRCAVRSRMEDSAEHRPENEQDKRAKQASYRLPSQAERCWGVLAGLRQRHTLEVQSFSSPKMP